MTMLDPPVFPERSIYKIGETGTKATDALLGWAGGRPFHPYGERYTPPSYSYKDIGQLVVFTSWINYYGTLSWRVTFGRFGQEAGLCSGYSTPEDAAYAACSIIEQQEREDYEQKLVVGLS